MKGFCSFPFFFRVTKQRAFFWGISHASSRDPNPKSPSPAPKLTPHRAGGVGTSQAPEPQFRSHPDAGPHLGSPNPEQGVPKPDGAGVNTPMPCRGDAASQCHGHKNAAYGAAGVLCLLWGPWGPLPLMGSLGSSALHGAVRGSLLFMGSLGFSAPLWGCWRSSAPYRVSGVLYSLWGPWGSSALIGVFGVLYPL